MKKLSTVVLLLMVSSCNGWIFSSGEGYLENCTFESTQPPYFDKCEWYSNETGRGSWMLTHQNSTDEQNSGWSGDHTTGLGYFWIARKTEDKHASNLAYLEKKFRGKKRGYFSFWYCMADVGVSLKAEILPIVSDVAMKKTVFTVQGDGTRSWVKSLPFVVDYCFDFKIRLEARLEANGSWIAVDDFVFISGSLNAAQPSSNTHREKMCYNMAQPILSSWSDRDLECCCEPGFSGEFCQTNINECELSNTRCLNGGTCLDLVNGYTCYCADGFTGSDCSENINDCVNIICERNGTCMDGVNDYYCSCRSGFTGKHCEKEINDCRPHSCYNGGTCIDLVNDFVCRCSNGFEGKRCERDLYECQSSPCGPGTCIDGPGTYQCLCPPGSRLSNSSNLTCEVNYNSCLNEPCAYDMECENTLDGFLCHCITGLRGKFCHINQDDCGQNSCLNQGTCFDGINSFTCGCVPGYTGDRCQTEIDFCDGVQCNNGICRQTDAGFYCECSPGYTGQYCGNEINECASNPCIEGTCMDYVNSYTCACYDGWTGNRCNALANLCPGAECSSHSDCYNTVHGPVCVCESGYTGVRCETRINPCNKIQCSNGAVCRELVNASDGNDWNCHCLDKYVGKYCETELLNSLSGEGNQAQKGPLCYDFWKLPQDYKKRIILSITMSLLAFLLIGVIAVEITHKYIQENEARRDLIKRMYQYPYDILSQNDISLRSQDNTIS